MHRKLNSLLITLLLFLTLIYLIKCPNNVISDINFSISIWKDNLFPTLFPFFVVSNLLISYNFTEIIGNILVYPMKKIFNLPKECSFVLGISLFSGFPSGAKYTYNLIKNNIISEKEGERLLTFTHYANPIFILNMIGNILLNNRSLAVIILLSHIISGLLTGYIFNHNYNLDNNIKIKKDIINNKTFGSLLTSAIMDSLNTMFLLLGIVSIFLIFTSFINSIFNLPPLYQGILSGILEMTQGVKIISSLNINELLKIIIITGIISFGGISVHMQVFSIINDTKIKYSYFLLARIIHTILAIITVFILYNLFIQYLQ